MILLLFSCLGVSDSVMQWTAACHISLLFTISHILLKLMSIELVMPSNHLILCRPLLLLVSIFPSIRVFSYVSVLHIRWPKYQSFSFNISPSNEYSGLISFRMDWFDILLSKGLSRVFSNTTVQKHQFFSAQPSFWSNPHICTSKLEKNYSFDYMDSCWQSNISALNTLSKYLHTQSLNTLSGFSSKEQASFNS